MGNEEKEYKGYFHPWKGTHYKDGINGTTILVIGVQHWCDPSYWYCEEKTPHECLKKRDRTCTVWNRHKYEENEKCYEWINEENKTMPSCPLALLDERSQYKCKDKERDECLNDKFRFLHCETKISIYEHIRNQGKRKRAQIFVCLSDALTTLFPNELKEEEKKEYYFDRIVFANYIQHYTLFFYRYGELNPDELKKDPDKDKEGFKRNFELFENGPDLIIVLQEKIILEKVKKISIVKNNYVHLEKKDELKSFYILAKRGSKLYSKYVNDDTDNFIKHYTQKWKKKGSTTHDIEMLAQFLYDFYKKVSTKKSMKAIREQIVKQCPSEIQEDYYNKKNGDFNDNIFRTNKNKSTYTTDEIANEIDNIKNKYNKYINGDLNEVSE